MSMFSKRIATLVFGFALETSVMSLMCLTYERLAAIRSPFRYRQIVSKVCTVTKFYDSAPYELINFQPSTVGKIRTLRFKK